MEIRYSQTIGGDYSSSPAHLLMSMTLEEISKAKAGTLDSLPATVAAELSAACDSGHGELVSNFWDAIDQIGITTWTREDR